MKFSEPIRIKTLLQGYKGIWCVAGGWAIDLYLNKETRQHHDIEIAIPRLEQLQLQHYLQDWKLRYVVSGQFFDWKQNTFLELPIHEIHGHHPIHGEIEILLNEIDVAQWRFRRNLAITYPLSKTILKSNVGISCLCPEAVLLYKAKWKEGKDESDFLKTIPYLSESSKQWLKTAIIKNHGIHEWVEQL